MIYVEQCCQMGNQMFSYAAARALQLKYGIKEKIAFDYRNFFWDDNTKNYIFDYKCADNIIAEDRKMNPIQRFVLKCFYKKRHSITMHPYDGGERLIEQLEEKYQDFLSRFGIFLCYANYHDFKYKPLPIFKNWLLIGFFESPNFFKECDKEIKEDFKPKDPNYETPYMKELITRMEASNSVCLQGRRGDFENSDRNKAFCSVCNEKYFKDAVEIIKEKVDKPKFFISTNDIDWAKSLNLDCDYEIIDTNKINTPQNLYVISKCKNFIISNSTYGFWAQHLSDNKDKIVIAPDRWRNITPDTHTGIYEDNWTLVKVD